MTSVLKIQFFQREPKAVARELIGKILVRQLGEQILSGRIVETEAYLFGNDAACHANKHRTRRTEVMFGAGGVAYVYPIHSRYCFNIVTEREEVGSAVLIRALEPIEGIAQMIKHRRQSNPKRLASGPACLCEAMGIDRSFNGVELTRASDIWVEDDKTRLSGRMIRTTARIGVTSAKNRKLRFVWRGHEFASGPKYLR